MPFVAKLDPSGSLLWNTFLGSAKSDGAQGIAVDNNSIDLTGYSDLTWEIHCGVLAAVLVMLLLSS